MKAYDREEAPRQITLSSDDVRDAQRLLRLLAVGGTPYDTIDPRPESSPGAIRALARFALLARQNRSQHFSPAMFGEPAWDLLLALFVNELDPEASTVSNLAMDAGIPITTALRWMDYLKEKRLIERQRSSRDRRVSTIILSRAGREAIESYFADVLAKTALVASLTSGNPSVSEIADRLSNA